MSLFEQFFTILAMYFIINGILCFIYPRIVTKTRFGVNILSNKGRSFILHRMFGTNDKYKQRLFYLGVLWILLILDNYSINI